jgi:hypothetical protein
MWYVELDAIVWDDGKGNYDVRGLPSTLYYHIRDSSARDKDEAIERALEAASDLYGSLIEGCRASAYWGDKN